MLNKTKLNIIVLYLLLLLSSAIGFADTRTLNQKFESKKTSTDILKAHLTTAVDDQVTVAENSGSTSIDVLDNDTLQGKGVNIVSITQPVNGSASIIGFNILLTGIVIDYQPNVNYCNDGNPTDDFTYTLSGGSSATVSVTVTCINAVSIIQTVPANQWQWLLLLAILVFCIGIWVVSKPFVLKLD